ncbi:Hypothetical protein Minf_0037 [Methylacidiphilum infernorum V4]|uniref:Uncharacterized protein n=1 Tax=Methylacidiphilum infernorum (isolate V4) TaxID=481448 RepID=B3DWK2_METI4|nr:Hypothetical protein Minf_0037 [Methylacidiphilum infernorum V4]
MPFFLLFILNGLYHGTGIFFSSSLLARSPRGSSFIGQQKGLFARLLYPRRTGKRDCPWILCSRPLKKGI